MFCFFFFSSRRRHTRSLCDWSSDVCSSDLHFVDAAASVRGLLPQIEYPVVVKPARSRILTDRGWLATQIGRASCRESVDLGGGRISKKKRDRRREQVVARQMHRREGDEGV